MTKAEFLIALAKTATIYEWTISNGVIRTKDANGDLRYCPITAVCHAQTGATAGPYLYHTAAKVLDLDVWQANDIAYAADHGLPIYPSDTMALLRQQILTALNLQEALYASQEE